MIGAQESRLRMLFVDEVNFPSLLRVWALGHSLQTIWHFEPIAPSWQRLLRVFRRLGLIRAEVRQIDHHIGQVRNDAGESEYVKLLGYARAICSKIKREQLANNPLIRAMGSEWARSKVLLYFERLAEEEVQVECLRIGLVEWMLRTQLHIAPAQCLLLIERRQWFSYLEARARSRGIRLVAYGGHPWDPTKIARIASRLFRASRKVLAILLRTIRGRLRRPEALGRSQDLPGKPAAEQRPPASTVAMRYWYRKLSFDPTERSEFFWLNGSGIPYSEVLLYDYVADKPLDAETLNQSNARGIRLLGRGPGIPTWLPTQRMFTVLLRTVLKLTLGVLTCMARGQWASFYYVRKLLALALDYAYWYDFYATNRVRVNVGTLNTSVGQVLALDTLNGVSVAYQYSASNILSPTTLLSAGENIQFVFSPVFERLWRCIETPVDNFVHTGFIYDNAIQAMRGLDRVSERRKQLQDNGARFILCFFDENSTNRWEIPASNDEAADDYEFLLNWLLDDSTLGIVFKPKAFMSLFQRIARVSSLIEQANQTGRCTFIHSDTFYGSTYPAEAALMADVCIGKLSGSTATLEACLAGVPTVLIDIDGFRSHPFHAWGRGWVVFDDWESLRVAVERYRTAPEAHPEFGDWSPGLSDLDPFRDGQASLRMGLHVRWVYEALKQGASKRTALAVAAEQFAQRWGDASINSAKLLEAGKKGGCNLPNGQ